MTSKIKVDNISDQSDNNIINESGDVITVGAAGDTVAVAGNIVKSNALRDCNMYDIFISLQYLNVK